MKHSTKVMLAIWGIGCCILIYVPLYSTAFIYAVNNFSFIGIVATLLVLFTSVIASLKIFDLIKDKWFKNS